MSKRKYAKEHSTAYKVGASGLEIVRRVSKNFGKHFPELSVKYSTVNMCYCIALTESKLSTECSDYIEFLKKYMRIIIFWFLCKMWKGRAVWPAFVFDRLRH